MSYLMEDSSGILQTFWGLSSLEEDDQLQSAKQLIISLRESQSSDDELCSDLEYTLKRLIRGLASNRKGARQGYFIALTELLTVFPVVPVSQVFQLIKAHLEPTGSDKAAEERGMYFGKLFALLSLIKSGRVTDKEDIATVGSQLHSCSQRKTYLKEFCYVSIAHLADLCQTQGSNDVIRDHVIPLALDTGWDECSPEQLYLYLHLSTICGKEKWFKRCLSEKLGTKHILSRSTIDKLAPVLVKSTTSHPRLHSVWPLVLDGVRVKGHLDTFWTSVVDDALFSSSHERRFLGFKLLESLLPTLSVSEVCVVFSPNLLSCLLNNLWTKDNYLHQAARHSLSCVCAFIKSSVDNELLFTLYLHLQRSTTNKFDQLTESMLTKELLPRLSEEGVEEMLDRLLDIFCDPDILPTKRVTDEGTDSHSTQLWALDQILLHIRQRRVPRHSSLCLLKTVRTLLLCSLFKIPTTQEKCLPSEMTFCLPKAPLSSSLQLAVSKRLTSVLSDLSSLTLQWCPTAIKNDSCAEGSTMGQRSNEASRGRRSAIPGVKEDGGYFLTALLEFAHEMLGSEAGYTLLQEFTDEVSEEWINVCEHVSALSKKEGLCAEERAFLLLFSAIGLQLLCSVEERKTLAKTAQEVSICFSEMSQSLNKKRTPKKSKSGHGWMAVLTDVLLGLLSNTSQLWRNVVEQVFKQLTHCITEDSLKLILEVLEPKQSKDDLMEEDDEDSEAGDSGEGSEAGDSGEGGEARDDSDSGDGSDAGGGGEDSDSGESVGGVDTMDPMFRAEVRKALGAAALDSDAESEESLDDEAMMAVDDALAEVFRTRFALKHQKKAKQDQEKSVVHFKLRVLGLLEAFIRKETTNPLVLDLVVPLYEVVQGSQSRRDHAPLVERAKGIFSNRLCHMKEYPKANTNVPHIHDSLRQLVDHLGKANTLTAPLLTQGFLLLVRVLRGNNTSAPPPISPLTTRSGRKRRHTDTESQSDREHGDLNVSEVTSWLTEALREFITKKNSNINPSFFSTYIERYPSLGAHLVPQLIEFLPSSASNYRKAQLYEMLAVLRGHCDGRSPYDQLADEDLAAVEALTSRSKKRKRSKQKK